MDAVNKIIIGDFSIGAKKSNAQKQEAEKEAPKASVGSEEKRIDADALFNAMNIAGMQNKAQITRSESKVVNPADYLTEDRISDIEAMMGEFENGVGAIADVITDEFPGAMAEDAVNALAAKIFAAE